VLHRLHQTGPIDPDRGRRMPLSHVDGASFVEGDDAESERLARAFRVSARERELPIHGVHGLHPYPARLHPAWARHLLADLAPGTRVHDPFCGSGTVLVEAMGRGLPASGGDLSRFAVRLAHAKTQVRDQRFLEAFARAAVDAHREGSERRETPWARLAQGERRYPPHVLAQLISLRAAIDERTDGEGEEVREALLLAFSPLVTKFMNRDNRDAPEVNRRAVRDHFLRRCQGMAAAWADQAEQVGPDSGSPVLRVTDARRTGVADGAVDVVLSSPPYPGVYDYLAEVREYERWIGDPSWIEAASPQEIGRRGTGGTRWRHMMEECFLELGRILRPGGKLYLVVGDGAAGAEAVRADDVISRILRSPKVPFRFVAAASQIRPHFHKKSLDAYRDDARREHLVLLERNP
jgi:SAM-dependent methyltransferase